MWKGNPLKSSGSVDDVLKGWEMSPFIEEKGALSGLHVHPCVIKVSDSTPHSPPTGGRSSDPEVLFLFISSMDPVKVRGSGISSDRPSSLKGDPVLPREVKCLGHCGRDGTYVTTSYQCRLPGEIQSTGCVEDHYYLYKILRRDYELYTDHTDSFI